MSLIRKSVQNMLAYIPGEQAKEKIIKLNQNENCYPPSPNVEIAIKKAINEMQRYPDSTSTVVREAAAKVYNVSPNLVMVTNGSDEMLRILFQACCNEYEEVLSFYPGYTYYETLASIQNVTYRLIQLENDYALPKNLDVGKAKLIFLANPNAPSGFLYSEKEIIRLLEEAPNAVVCIDEAYADFANYTAIKLLPHYKNLVVTRTFSKSYALAGLRVGLGFASLPLMAEFEKVRDYYNLDVLAQAGATAALEDQEYLQKQLTKIKDNREFLTSELRKKGLEVYPSQANFILLKFKNTKIAEETFLQLKQQKIYVRYFNKPRLSDCLRITIGTREEITALINALNDKY